MRRLYPALCYGNASLFRLCYCPYACREIGSTSMVSGSCSQRCFSARSRATGKDTQGSLSSSAHGRESVTFLNTTGMPVGEVMEGRRGFLGFGRHQGRTMPLNPLATLRPHNVDEHEERCTAHFLQAVEKLHGKRRRRAEGLTLQLTAEQQHDIVNRYAKTRWFGILWHPFRNVTERQFKWWRRIAHLFLLIVTLLGFAVTMLLYYREMEAVLQLSPEDRRDYEHIVTGMRFSEIYSLSMEVLKREDPLEALPAPARYRLLLEAARAKGWHQIDWALEARTRYPRSPLEDMDFIHLFYWSVMYTGLAVTGGGELFSDRFGDLVQVRGLRKKEEVEASFVEVSAEPPVANTSQSHRAE
ncbi:hypothetical protein ERJ75_000931900 [Trypanosoma vivax]|uniref:Transmembrane protein n=1 Tax=Trypanosoma vivax (strain Y486) TaxID=1055687 RepID=G0U429_TRYVY|nr:hypothetical protein TRVL_02481 [Trypanosoma vivax]KAH8612108.1 hypothetical protein ERJ75_000931900 [Trypanosoma vivax]CCC52191.1 conserved hypothetical protein [Trypanosoma vivax Y486]